MIINIHRKKRVTQILLVSFLFIITFTIFLNIFAVSQTSNHSHLKTNSGNQVLSKKNFTPLIEEEKYGLGNISIFNFNYHKKGFTNSTTLFPQVYDDVNQGALNITYLGTQMIENTQIAKVDNLKEGQDSLKLKVLLNDSLEVSFDKSIIPGFNGYLIYRSQLSPMDVKEIYINGTKIKEGEYYFYEQRFIKFYYYNYFGQISKGKFSMQVVFEFEISLQNWDIYQASNENLVVTNKEQVLEPTYTYLFNLVGQEYTTNQLESFEDTDDLEVELIINLPDKHLLENHILTLNQRIVGDSEFQNYLDSNKTIDISLLTNNTLFSLNFTAQFTFKFVEPLFRTFGIDRLYNDINIRERIYFPTITSGPRLLLVQYVSIFERDFEDEDVVNTYSQFDRIFTYIDANDSVNTEIKKGIEITLPFLIKGEVCPISIRYRVQKTLRIIVNDNINTPVYDLKVRLNYYGKEFGTFISNNWTQPTAPLITDQNGEIILNNVPEGNYSLDVFYDNQIIKTQSVSTSVNPNIISTNIPHFPLVFLIFLSISGSIFISGLIIYLINKRYYR